MESKTFDAKATATDAGEFTAIAAAYSVDRVGDRIIPGAFAKTIEDWQMSGKLVPLHWNHEGDPASIIGSVDPASMTEGDDGLRVSGSLDLKNSETAREAWRAMKTGSMSLSFGYVVTKETRGKDGINNLEAIDLFEVSVVPAPANKDTIFTSLKRLPDASPQEVAGILTHGLRTLRDQVTELRKRIDELDAALEEKPSVEDEHEEAPAVTHQASDPEAVNADLALIEALTN